jgi:DNA-binding transcriptional LysR family regulator
MISMELDSTEGLLSAVEAGLGITFVSRWAARNHLSLGTLKIARVHGFKLSRRFSMAYPAGPAPAGIVGLFRTFLLFQAMEMAPKKVAITNTSPLL